VLESGPNLTNDPNVLSPAGINLVTRAANYTTSIPSRPEPNLNNITYPLNWGDMWGGSSAHYRELCVRPSPFLFDQRWARVGGQRWTYQSLLPSFRQIESFHPNSRRLFNAQQRGAQGPLDVRQTELTPLGKRVAAATESATGVRIEPDYNAGLVTAVSDTVQLFQRDPAGTRSFGADFLARIIDAQGNGVRGRPIRVRSDAKVIRIMFEGEEEEESEGREQGKTIMRDMEYKRAEHEPGYGSSSSCYNSSQCDNAAECADMMKSGSGSTSKASSRRLRARGVKYLFRNE